MTVKVPPATIQPTGPSMLPPVNQAITAAIVPLPQPTAAPMPPIIATNPAVPDVKLVAVLINLLFSISEGAINVRDNWQATLICFGTVPM